MNNRRWYPVSRLAPEQIKVLKHSMDPSMTVLLPGVETATAYGCKLVSYHRGGEDQSRVDIDLPVALDLAQDRRAEQYGRLRTLLRAGQSQIVIEELERLGAGQPEGSPVWREIRYLRKHSEAGRLRYNCFRYRGVPLGSGAIESTIRRVINLRLKGNGIYWTEDNAEAVFQLRAAVVSGRWEEIVEHTREAMAKDRRTDWRWTPPECLAELKELDEEDDDVTQTSTRKQSKRSAA